jgi:uncharacterized repeat protein (TIGR03847 family)
MSAVEFIPDIFTADYVGEPGDRAFFLQARGSDSAYSFTLEKEQVAALAEKLREMLVLIDETDTISKSLPGRDPALALDESVEPQGRVGALGLAYEESADRVLVIVQEQTDEEPEEPIEEPLDEKGFRFLLRRDQVRSFVLHAEAIVGEGRPICQLCGLPMDPAGHLCPASNGHHVEA